MQTKTINDLFTNVSSDSKRVIDQFGDLVEIPKTQVPIEYSPETGQRLGILCEPPSTNYFPNSLDMDGGLALTNGVFLAETTGANSILFFPRGLYFDGGVRDRFISKSATFTFESQKPWFYVGISFFVKFPDDSNPPVYGRSYMEGTDFHFKINGLEGIEAGGNIDIHEMKDGSYWVRARIKTPSRPLNEISIGNSYWQTNRNFIITGLQIEPYMCTSPIITEGSSVQRSGNYIEFNAEPNKTINLQQGTVELGYYLNHGSVGSALYAFSDTQKWDIGHVGEFQDNHESEPISYSIKVNSTGYENNLLYVNDQKDFNLTDWQTNHDLKIAYSPYGNRFTTNDSLIYKKKNYNYNETLDTPTKYRLGISESGENINGYIRYFNIRARALTDEEIVING